jgi:hypothetical protein
MPISSRDKQELEQIYSDYKDKFNGRKEDYFALLYLCRKFKCTPEQIGNQVDFQGHDYGLDAFYLDRPSFNLYLYQFKWSEDHNLFKQSMQRLTTDGLKRIFGNAQTDPYKSEILNTLQGELSEKPRIDHVFVHMVFMGDLEKVDGSKGLRERREALEQQQQLVREFFGNDQTELRVEFITHLRPPPPPPLPDEGIITFTQHTAVRTSDGIKMYVGFVRLMDLYRIWQSLDRRFFSRNIRFGLEDENAPNKKMREALSEIVLQQTRSPDVFPFHHNGVTLAAERILLQDGTAKLVIPRLLNGAQTIMSLKKFVEDNSDKAAFKAGADRLESICVLAKIVEDNPSSKFVTAVTICNNRQNPVDPWNLRANDQIQCDLEDKLRENGHVYYARQERAFENMSADELLAMNVDPSRGIRICPLAQTFLAVQGEIARMSKLPDVFEEQKQYEDTFRKSYLDADERKIVLTYKVYLMIRAPMGHLEEVVAQKWGTPIRRGRNLIWALLIQGMLNDSGLPDLLDKFGGDLNRPWEFRDYLKKLASSKVKKILLHILNHRDYADRLEREKYDFLRSKETYQRCMEYAYKEFGWVKKNL